MTLHTYLPQDRLRALSRGETLPDRTSGSALFADISGFTPLAESLRNSLGTRRGGEELNKYLNLVYGILIAELERYGGSVIGFAGDAMMCWFDASREVGDQGAGGSAVSCAFGMQTAIKEFPELGLKVAITSGDARRFVVGDPDIQKLDALAGATVARASTAEHQANKGDVVLDEATANALNDSLTIQEWREDHNMKERFAVITKFTGNAPAVKTKQIDALRNDIVQSWVHTEVFERETSGSAFLTEFRPCVAVFVRFMGIDYDVDSAEAELDVFIRQVQSVAARYGGTLMDITIGDKGSYAYINFGALISHEDDARRAVKAALELRNKAKWQLQIGITQGVLRVGAYGGVTRKTFGALGDDVNLAARLMSNTKVGEILISGHVYKAVMNHFVTEPLPPLNVKGKAEPITVYKLLEEQQRRAIRLQEPNYALPMVGRVEELKRIEEKLALAVEGKSQVIGIVAEAGLGKSRLVAEVIRSARKKGFVGYGGACQSDSIHTPYQAWKSVWQAFFDVDHEIALKRQMRLLEGDIEDRAPSRVSAMPLLNVVLDLSIPENEFTQNLEPKIRQSALHALLEDCLKASTNDEPLLIVIEDMHWIDALSHDLLEQLAKALANYPVCFVLAYRPPEIARLEAPRLEALAQFTKIELHELTTAEAESAIRAKLAQLYPERAEGLSPVHGGTLPAGLAETLIARAQGNPFYLEELLNYVRDRGLDPADIENIELPDSLHALILSRIDQLSEQQKTTLRVASIVGRLFRAGWLMGYYPELGAFPQVKAALDALEALEITPLDSPEPELAYLFKHIVTHEVTYESLPFATRAKLHEQLAKYLENAYPEALPLEALSFHYGRSDNTQKQMEYLRKAGEVAQENFANAAALDYYGKLLVLLKDDKEKTEIHLQRGQVFELLGNWDEAESDYRAALELAKADAALTASAQFALGKINRLRGDYASALEWLGQAQELRTTLDDEAGLAQVLIETGIVLWCKGEYATAREISNEGLALVREMGDKLSAARALNALGNIAIDQGDYAAAQALYEESLSLRRELGDKYGISASLNNLGNVAKELGNYAVARALYEESLSLDREMGDKWGIAIGLSNVANVVVNQGDYVGARALSEESLRLRRELGDKEGVANSLNNLGYIVYSQGDYVAAREVYEESLRLRRKLDDKDGIAVSLNNLGVTVYGQGDYATARALFEESLRLCQEMNVKRAKAYALFGLGLVNFAVGNAEAHEHLLHSLRLRQEIGEQPEQVSNLIGMAVLVLQAGHPQFAAQLLGAATSALKVLNAVMEPFVKPFHAQTLAAVREQLSEAAFQSAWEEGSQWSLGEAVKRALGEG